MVHTKDCSGVKVSNKAHRKVSSTTAMESTSCKHSEKCSTCGGNPIHPRETPSWQKEITHFFPKTGNGETNQPSSSSANLECNTDVEQIQHQEVKEKTVKEVNAISDSKRKLNVNSGEESNSSASTYQSSVDDCHCKSSKDGSRAKNKTFEQEVEYVSSGEDCQVVSATPKARTTTRLFRKIKKSSLNKKIPEVVECIDITSTSDEDED